MFKELIPILENHEVLVTIGKLKDGKVSVIVNVLAEKGSDKPVIPALTAVATPEILDAEFSQDLVGYTAKSADFDKKVTDIADASAKAISEFEAENKKKAEEAKNKAAGKKTTTNAAAKKPEPAKEPEPPSLFSQPIEPAGESSPAAKEPESESDEADTDTAAIAAAAPATGTDAPSASLPFAIEAQSVTGQQPVAA